MHILFCFQPCICYHFSDICVRHFSMWVYKICRFCSIIIILASTNISLKVDNLILQTALVLNNDFLSLFFFISNWGFIFFAETFSKLIIWYFRQLKAFQYDGIHTQYIKIAYKSIFHNFNNFEGSYLRQQNTSFLIWHCNWYE